MQSQEWSVSPWRSRARLGCAWGLTFPGLGPVPARPINPDPTAGQNQAEMANIVSVFGKWSFPHDSHLCWLVLQCGGLMRVYVGPARRAEPSSARLDPDSIRKLTKDFSRS